MKVLELTNSDHPVLVDNSDFSWASKFRWTLDKSHGYVVRHEGPRDAQRKIYLHREIIFRNNLAKGTAFEIDHKNEIRTDNRKRNLRVCACDGSHQRRHTLKQWRIKRGAQV